MTPSGKDGPKRVEDPVTMPVVREVTHEVGPRLAIGTRNDLAPSAREARGQKRTAAAREAGEVVSMKPPVVVLAILGNVDDYEGVLDWVRRRGLIIDVVATGEEGLRVHREEGADLVLLGLPLPDYQSATMIGALRHQDPRATIVVVGRDAEIRSQLTALELGAQEYVADPVEGRRDLLFALGVSLGVRSSDPHVRMLRAREASSAEWRRIIGASPTMTPVMKRLREICERSVSGATPVVMFSGELGTGKHLLARALHYNGPRRHRPFAEVNCSALSPDEIHGQLFGQLHGAARQGLFESADGGTVFLDEIGAVTPALQTELLAAIEDRQIRRGGGDDLINIDVQIVAGTRLDLGAMVKRGEFRSDLYHRLCVRTIELPALRVRGADIVAIAEALLVELAAEHGFRAPQLAFDARDALAQHTWPGNIRELRNELERVLLLVDERVIRAEHFRFRQGSGAAAIEVRAGNLTVALTGDSCPIDRLEYEVIREALARCKGNISRAARFLGITRQTMHYRMKKHHLRGTPSTDAEDR